MAFAQAVNTSTLVHRNGQADTVQLDGHEALLRELVRFMADKPTLSVSYVGTGNGQINYLDGGVGGVTETWTITLTGGGTTFSVSGSVSGAQTAGTVGVDYTTTGSDLTSLLSFVITAGGTAFINGDVFTVAATTNTIAAADVWVLDAWNNFDLFTDQVGGGLWWHGAGDGTQAIYCGIRLQDNAPSSIWNWVTRSATGYSGSQVWSIQPGVSPEYFTAFWDNDMLYWMIGSGRRYSVAAKVSTTYHAMYQGLFLPFGSPTEYPLPLCNLGEKDDEEAWNSVAPGFDVFCIPSSTVQIGGVRDVAGAWLDVSNSASAGEIQFWPAATFGYFVSSIWDNHENFNNGDHQLFPVVLITGPVSGTSVPLGANTFGVLDGIRRVTGFGNSAETILTISAVDHVVFQNIARTTREHFWTMEMA
jgi:hypothetical protein